MNRSALLLPLLTLALCATCAEAYSATTDANRARVTVCQDGSVVTADRACAPHGGVDRQSTYARAFPSYW